MYRYGSLQNPASEEPAEESRLLALLANVLEAMVDATEQREQARLQARLQVHGVAQRARMHTPGFRGLQTSEA